MLQCMDERFPALCSFCGFHSVLHYLEAAISGELFRFTGACRAWPGSISLRPGPYPCPWACCTSLAKIDDRAMVPC